MILQEIESLLSMFKIDMRFLEKPKSIVSWRCYLFFINHLTSLFQEPYWIVEFKSESDVKLLASRSVSLKNCLELWGYANNIQVLHNKLKKLPSDVSKQHFQTNKSFKIEVETFCKHFSQKEKIEKIEVIQRKFK